MSLRHAVTLNRLGAPGAFSGGSSERAATTQVLIQATVSPMSPDAVKAAFESTQGRSSYSVVSSCQMFPFSSDTPDSLEIDGETFECRSCVHTNNGVQPHYTAIFTSLVPARAR